MTMTKVCSKCQKDKPITDFYKDKKSKDVLSAACKVDFKGVIKHSKWKRS